MIRDFKKTKENLREIADVINSFKSEAVQLRLLELVLSMEDKEEEVVVAAPAIVEEIKPAIVKRGRRPKKEKLVEEETEVKAVKKETRGRKPKKVEIIVEPQPEVKVEPKPEVVEIKTKEKKEKVKAAPKPKAEKKSTHERPGPSVILRTLVADKYFDQNRTIGDVVKHCLVTYQFQYASTDLSGTLARLVKENILKREKNAQTNQFEYSLV